MAKADELGVDDVHEILTGLYSLDGDVAKGQFRTLCPVHEDNSPSCDVDLTTGYWNCFSCPASGDLVDLGVVVLEEIPFEPFDSRSKKNRTKWGAARKKVEKLLKPDDPDAISAAVRRRLRAARKAAKPAKARKDRFQPTVPPVAAYEFKFHPYLRDRGFTKETLKRWKIRFSKKVTLIKEDGDSFTLTNAICIPIFEEDGTLVGWCYRATEESEPWFRNVRYIYTPGITDVLSQMWFGMNLHGAESEVAICEGALDAIWCDQNGIPALAILGSQVKQLVKVRQLMRFRNVALFTDKDTAGMTTAYHLGVALQERGVGCTVCRYLSWMSARRLDDRGKRKPAKDAQDLCGVDIELVYARAIPFLVWKQKNRAA